MLYIFFGDDAFTIEETVAGLRRRMVAEDAAAEFNVTELDGRRITLGELESAASALPFLGERRLVLVRDMLARCNPRSGDAGREPLATGLRQYLPAMPPTTRLVCIEGNLAGDNPVLRWAKKQAQADAETVVVRSFEAPKAAALPGWLSRRATAKGGAIEADAARGLAEALTRDGAVELRIADNELEKLLTYAAGRAVNSEDVSALVTPISLDSIFRFVDALAEGNGKDASTLLHQFLSAGEHPLRILALIGRQVRLLARTKSLLEEGVSGADLPSRLPVPPFVARKLERQAKRFTMPFLVSAVRRVAEIDTDIKTGEMNEVLALDLFVAGMCGAAS